MKEFHQNVVEKYELDNGKRLYETENGVPRGEIFNRKDAHADEIITCERCPFVAERAYNCPASFIYDVHLLQYHPKFLSERSKLAFSFHNFYFRKHN